MEPSKTMPKKNRKPSALFALKSLKNNIQKMKDMKMITEPEYEQFKKLYGTITQRWIGGNLLE